MLTIFPCIFILIDFFLVVVNFCVSIFYLFNFFMLVVLVLVNF